jgi:putative sterol carrier protein
LALASTDHILAVQIAKTRSATVTADPINDFFAGLAEPGHLATFEHEVGTVRFDVADATAKADITDVEHWHVTIDDGDVTVTREPLPAEAVVRIARPYLELIVTGRLNAVAAMLRGLLTVEGSVAPLMMFQRCLPGPPGSTGKVAPISSQAVMAQRRPK